jgi:4-amino-4-deoxy-L-arabinose transferase-like glycosyltransferase
MFAARSLKPLVLVFALALVVRLVYCFGISPLLNRRAGAELGWTVNGKIAFDPYDQIARNLVEGKGYVDDTLRRNYERPPGYVFFLAGLYRLWGFDLWKVQIAQAVLDSASCVLVFLITALLFRDRRLAVWAAAFHALYYKMINMVTRPMSETLFAFLLLVFVLLFVLSFSSDLSAFAAGTALGLTTLTRPVTLLFPVVAAVLYLVRLRRHGWRRFLLLLVAFLLVTAPVVVCNGVETGHFFFALGGGKILYMGAVIDYSKPIRNEEMRLVNEIQKESPAFPYDADVDAKLGAAALRRIEAAPLAYAGRVLYRLYLFWTYPDYSTPLMAVKTLVGLLFSGGVCALAIFGMIAARAKKVAVAPLLSVVLYSYGLYALFYAHPRYSLVVLPILFVFAPAGAAALWRRRKPA